jgi:hypothetical protein
MVITYDIPDSNIQNEVRELTGKQGKIVFLSLGNNAKDFLEFKHRYGITKAGVVVTDEFGNPLKCGMMDSEGIVDAYYELDELMADLYQTWHKSIEKGKSLIKKEHFPEAADALKIFAFARGTEKAEEGRKLYYKVSQEASKEYEKLVADTKDKKPDELDMATRDRLIAALTAFIKKWPKTPAAFSAETLKSEIISVKEVW